MARPVWKGHLSFGLVNIPVSLYTAEAREVNFDLDMLDGRDHAKIRFRRVNERTGREVPWSSIVKGVRVNDEYVVLEPTDFKRAAAEVSKGLEILEFVKRDVVSPLLFERPYYLSPGEGGDKGYALLRDALKKSDRIGIAKLVIHTRERLAAILAQGDVLTVITMRFSDEVRSSDMVEAPGAAKLAPREIELASKLIDGMTGKWNPSQYHDTYRETLSRIVKQKAKAGGKDVEPIPEEPRSTPRTELMDLLRQSVEGQGGTSRGKQHRRPGKPRVHAKRRAGRAG